MAESDTSYSFSEAASERQYLQWRIGSQLATEVGLPGALRAVCVTAVQVLQLVGAAVSIKTGTGEAGFGPVAASSSRRAQQVEELEFTTGEGPGVDAFATSRPVLTSDLNRAFGRWPAYAPAAIAAGVEASFAFPLHVGAVRFGVLHLQCSQTRTLTDRQVSACLTLADVATEFLLDAAAPSAEQELSHVLFGGSGGRDQIYQAQGMVSVELGVSLTEALARLRARAFASGLTLSTLASTVVDGTATLIDRPDEPT